MIIIVFWIFIDKITTMYPTLYEEKNSDKHKKWALETHKYDSNKWYYDPSELDDFNITLGKYNDSMRFAFVMDGDDIKTGETDI